ncbi:hypothetical protein POJ06DRAFT_270657 [Lipomyces tetrasporus]|uniref:Uncharacterized protein n=1 Tax=Lipomyces tetrasporus TaxID=54092 RepID=A0AAD7QM49_9ASCO|nr:uncharacterized protein POJ06DRAFT_270657 [Lipomyces tetrasporus]KAJ8097842.1 hypothetical protein POJ06DRAFT_270657 [Lipomyces tetrasporus]
MRKRRWYLPSHYKLRLWQSPPTRPEEDPYQRAVDFLSANEPEKYLRVQLPIDKYEKLQSHAETLYGEKKYPYIDYCPDTSTVVIYTAPLRRYMEWSLHTCKPMYHAAAVELELLHNKPELVHRLKAYGESTNRPSFEGYGRRISKTPDGGLIYYFNNRRVLALVIETRPTEDYHKLQRDIRLWLHGMRCRTGILICLQEEPKVVAEISNETPFGPLIYNGHRWFGKLGAVFAEVHRRVDADGEIQVEPKWLVRSGTFVVDDEKLDFGLTLGDLFPEDDADAPDVRSVVIKLSTEDVKGLLVYGVTETALVRFRA